MNKLLKDHSLKIIQKRWILFFHGLEIKHFPTNHCFFLREQIIILLFFSLIK